MGNKVKKIGRFICMASLVLPFVCLANIPQAAAKEEINSALIKHLLSACGIKAQMVELQHPDGFSKAVLIEGPQEIPIIIGFNEDNTGKPDALLISIDGYESIVNIQDDGTYEITQGDFDLGTAICVLDSVFDMLTGIVNCGEDRLCVATTIFTTIVGIITCVNIQIS